MLRKMIDLYVYYKLGKKIANEPHILVFKKIVDNNLYLEQYIEGFDQLEFDCSYDLGVRMIERNGKEITLENAKDLLND